MSTRENIAGMSIGGGRKENFFFCILEYYQENGRWFLSSLHQVKDEDSVDSDEAIAQWIKKYSLKGLIVDVPLSRPVCDSCQLECPGTKNCHQSDVVAIKKQMASLLLEDSKLIAKNPKAYEEARVEDNLVHYSRDIYSKAPDKSLLSKSFKRKLKKGFIPYWNRPLDFWIWKNYYDYLLNLFNISYDSFNNVSTMLLSKFKYLLRHLPKDLTMFESQSHICLIELHRAGIITTKHILNLNDLDQCVLARLDIIRAIEKKCEVFIYDHDLELIVKNPKAFDSFLLALVGKQFLEKSQRKINNWALPNEARFIVPNFLDQENK